jgi:hypothetical protein
MPRVPRLTALLAACLALLVATTHLPTGVQAASIESNRRDNGFPDLYEATFEELQSGLDGGKFTSVDLVKVCTTVCILPCSSERLRSLSWIPFL